MGISPHTRFMSILSSTKLLGAAAGAVMGHAAQKEPAPTNAAPPSEPTSQSTTS